MERGNRREGRVRENMAEYFVSVPSFKEQTPLQKRRTKRKLGTLWRTETNSALRCIGEPRIMRQGDVLNMVVAVLRSAVLLTGRENSNLSVITPLRMPHIIAAMEPRLLQLSLISLLKENVKQKHVAAEVMVLSHAIRICIRANGLCVSSHCTLPLLQETARLHGGSLAVEKHSVSLEINTQEKGEALFAVPGVLELTHGFTAIPVMGLIRFLR